MEELLRRLQTREGMTGEELAADDLVRDSTLWIMIQLVTLAASAANHVASSALGRSGSTYVEAFELLVEAGVVEAAMLPSLRGASAMRNVLVHQYDDVDLDLVANAIPKAVEIFSTYIQDVSGWLLDRGQKGPG
jgi:uncharacterized protein YutE (UPF0331/DUF86 family)